MHIYIYIYPLDVFHDDDDDDDDDDDGLSYGKLPRSQEHCMKRFAVRPQPKSLVDLWGFDEATLVSSTSRILFVNGLNDGWSVGGILQDLSKERLGIGKLEWLILVDLHKLSSIWVSTEDPKTCSATQLAMTRTKLRPRHLFQLQKTSADGGRNQNLDAEFFVDCTHWCTSCTSPFKVG